MGRGQEEEELHLGLTDLEEERPTGRGDRSSVNGQPDAVKLMRQEKVWRRKVRLEPADLSVACPGGRATVRKRGS